jgi:adenylate kinase family enzyme
MTGSGKTTLARRLAEILRLPAIELDAIFWQPNWQATPAPEFKAKVQAALDAYPRGWVCDGTYHGRLGDLVLSQCDSAIWLHIPWRVSFWRLLKRTVSRAWSREPLWNGNKESWRLSFLSRDSVLLWSISHHRAGIESMRRHLAGLPPAVAVYDLRSSRDVEAFLKRVADSSDAPSAIIGL